MKTFKVFLLLFVSLGLSNYTSGQGSSGCDLKLNITATDISCFGANDGKVDLKITGGTTPYYYGESIFFDSLKTSLSSSVYTTYNPTGFTAGANGLTFKAGSNGGFSVKQAFKVEDGTTIKCKIFIPGTKDVDLIYTTSSLGGFVFRTRNNGDIIIYTTDDLYRFDETLTIPRKTAGNWLDLQIEYKNRKVTLSAKNTTDKDFKQSGTFTTKSTPTSTEIQLVAQQPKNYFIVKDLSVEQVNPSNSSLKSGTYKYAITDANGCKASATAVIKEPKKLQLNSTVKDIRCYGDNNGEVELITTGGIKPYTLGKSEFTDNDNTDLSKYHLVQTTASKTSKGLELTPTQAAAALTTYKSYKIKDGQQFEGSIFLPDTGYKTIIVGLNDGKGTSTANMAYAIYFSSFSNNYSVSLYHVLNGRGSQFPKGSFTIKPGGEWYDYKIELGKSTIKYFVKKASDDSYSNVKTVNHNGLLDSCKIGLTHSKNTRYKVAVTTHKNWNLRIPNADTLNLNAGTFKYYVTDANGCLDSVSSTINEPQELKLQPTVTHISCYGANDGKTALNISGGTAPYTNGDYAFNYSFNGALNKSLFDSTNITTQPTSNGLEIIANSINTLFRTKNKFEMAVGNEFTSQIFIKDNGYVLTMLGLSNGTAGSKGFNKAIYFSGHTGALKLYGVNNGGGGIMPTSSYTLSNGGNWFDVKISIKTNTVEIALKKTTESSFTNSKSFAFNNHSDSLYLGIYTQRHPSYSLSTPIIKNWKFGKSSSDTINLAPGTFKYLVKDANECAVTTSATINEPTQLKANAVVVSNVSCFGLSNGLAKVTVTGGTQPYKIEWSNSDTTSQISTLAAGSYSVKITDKNGCTVTDTIIINQPNPLVSSQLIQVSSICMKERPKPLQEKNSSTGGTGTYRYQWQKHDGRVFIDITGATSSSYQAPSLSQTQFYRRLIFDTTECAVDTSNTIKLQVKASPNAQFTSGDKCFTDSLAYFNKSTVASGSITRWEWNFGSRNTSSLENPKIGYSNSGAYQTQLIVETDSGCTDSITKTIVLYAKPKAVISAANSCVYDSISFNNKSQISTGKIVSYNWQFGDGNSSTSREIKHKYLVSGTYQAKLKVTSDSGCIDSASKIIYIHAKPTAKYTVIDGCVYDSAQFTNSSSITAGAITSYSWSFGDHKSSSIKTPKHLYAQPGSYATKLIVTSDSGCTDSVIKNLSISPKPIAQFKADDTCFYNDIALTNNSSISTGTISTYSWNFGDGNKSNAKAPKHQYKNAGSYTIQLILESNEGCFDTLQRVVKAHAKPIASFTNNTVCQENFTQFTDKSQVNNSQISYWNWSFGNGQKDNTKNPKLLFANAGNYPVQLIAKTNFGCTDTFSKTISVYAKPQANFEASIACEDKQVQFIDSSAITIGSITSYNWSFGNVSTSQQQNPINVYKDTGNYHVELIITSNNNCKDTFSQKLAVNPVPKSNFDVKNICLSDSAYFKSKSSLSAGALSYKWSFGDSTNSSLENPKHLFSMAGFYTVKLNVKSNEGCNDSISKTVQVYEMPTAGFTQSNVCLNDSMFFIDNSSAADKYSYYFGGRSMANTANAAHIYGKSGKYSVRQVVETNKGCIDSIRKTVEVYALPIANFSVADVCYTDSSKFVNSSSNAIDFNWNLGDGSSSALKAPTKLYGKAGNYTVKLIAKSSKGCLDTIIKTVTVNALPQVAFTMNDTCLGKANRFANNTTSASTYAWSFGDGNSSTAQAPSHTYLKDGNYDVELIATTSLGCQDSASTQITIHPLPQVSFVQSNVCYGNTMSFKNTSSIKSGLNSYAWNFGDGNSSANTSPAHSYNADGNYSVMLIATSSYGCADSSSKSIIVYALPKPSFTVNNECLTDTFKFKNTTMGATSYAWSFGDSKTSSAGNPQHQYSVTGYYTAKLIATSANNCVDSFSRKIQVYEMPTAGFTQNHVCLNDSMFFKDNSTAADKYSYYFGGRSMANTANAAHLYGKSGKYSVGQVVETNKGCIDSIRKTVEVYALPIANFSVADVCYTDSSKFVNSSSNAIDFNWNLGDGSSSALKAPTKLYGKAGNYTVKLIAKSSKGCLDTITKTVTVNALPQVAFTMNDTCLGKANRFDNNTTGASTYAWSFGDGNSSTAQAPSHTYLKDGNYGVELIATTSLGCQDSASTQITIHPLPQVSFVQSNVCYGNTMSFKNTSSISKGTNSYKWHFGDGNSSTNNSPIYRYSAATKYMAKLIATTDKGCQDSSQTQVEVYAQPVATFAQSNVCDGFSMYFTNQTKLAHNANWSFGDGKMSTDQNPKHLYANNGSYTVRLKTSTAHCSDSISKTVIVYKKPIAGIVHDSTCLGGQISFTNTSYNGEINTNNWTFGDGGTSALVNPKRVYKSHGSYNVELIVSTDHNCKDTATATAIVHPNPVARFNANNVCAYDSAVFNNVSSIATGSIAQHKWSFGNGLVSSNVSPSHLYGKSGNYTVGLSTISDFGCADFADTLITIYEVPRADFSSSTVCEEKHTEFTNSSELAQGFIKWYNWSFDDGNSSTGKDPRHLYTLFGNYNVQLIVESQNGCLDTVSKNIKVLDKPEAIFSAQTVCYLQSTEFNNASVSAAEWFWNFGDDEGFSGLENPNYNYLNPGIYKVELQVVSAQGCRDTVINQVEVYNLPIANFSVVNHCLNDELLPADKSLGNVNSWTWQMGDGQTLTGNAPSYIYQKDGEYIIKLDVEDQNGCSDSVKRKVIVHPLPKMGISADTLVSKGYQVSLLASGGEFYSWSPNIGLNKYDIANPVATVTEDVTYTVSVTTEYGCESDTIVNLRALDDYTVEPSNIITPDGNGKNDYWIVDKAIYYDDIEVIVFDRWGRIVYQAKPYKNDWDGTVNGKPLPDGAYYYIIKVPTERESYKGSITIFR